MNEILIATKNPGKLKEYQMMLEPLGYRVLSLLEVPDFPDIPETGSTFAENALLKARAVSTRFQMPCLADDSGLEVEALGGDPGVHSQRYSPEGIPAFNNAKLIRNLQGKTDRKARFVCVIAYFDLSSGYRTFEGTVEGEIVDLPRGTNGFGYDPHFYLPAFGKTMAELAPDVKNTLSHRGKALRKIIDSLSEAKK
jgi:XTP/dITP diphosphohydrolase